MTNGLQAGLQYISGGLVRTGHFLTLFGAAF